MRRAGAALAAAGALMAIAVAFLTWDLTGDALIGEDTGRLQMQGWVATGAAILLGTAALLLWRWPGIKRRAKREAGLLRAAREEQERATRRP